MAQAKQEERAIKRVEGGALLIPDGPRLGDKVIDVKDLSFAFDDRLLFEKCSFRLQPGQIMGVIGPNGSGKSTLLKLLLGQIKPRSGNINIGSTVQFGFNAQHRDTLKPENSVWREIADGREEIIINQELKMLARSYVAQFNFQGSEQQKLIKQLSGGERNRAMLAKSLAQGCNVILLDEPTNDLDVATLRALEEALIGRSGSAIVVSHDRWFLDRVCTAILSFGEDGTVEYYPGNFTAYEASKKKQMGQEYMPRRRKFKKI
jgi:ATPase subunit of ABC transporter with duplicated ATPase domains